MNTGLLATLTALALLDSTSFGTLGVPVYVLLASDRPARRLLPFLATLTAAYFTLGVGLARARPGYGATPPSRRHLAP